MHIWGICMIYSVLCCCLGRSVGRPIHHPAGGLVKQARGEGGGFKVLSLREA